MTSAKKVLVVDDEKMNIISLAHFLKPQYEIIVAVDGTSALEAAEKHLPDLILLDIIMPDMNGFAGLVGMNMLSQAALVVEQSLATGKTELLSDQMDTLEKELNAALDELTPIAAKTDKRRKAHDGYFNRNNVLKLLATLDSLLEADNFDSLNLVNDLSHIPGMEQLASQVESMKFKQARETLVAVRQQFADMQQMENSNDFH